MGGRWLVDKLFGKYLALPPATLGKLGWIAVLYFAEGFPFGIAYDIWPVYFREHGVSLREIGLMSLLFLPYTLKPVWAPLVDRIGSRQGWATTCQLVLAALCLVFLVLDPTRTDWMLWIVLLAFTLTSATQDISIDAYAIDVAEPREMGHINGTRAAAYRVALTLAYALLVLADVPWAGWKGLWVVCALLLVGSAAATWSSPRVPREAIETQEQAGARLWGLRAVLVAVTAAAVAFGYNREWDNLGILAAVLVGTLAMASFLDPAMLRWLMKPDMVPVLVFVVGFKVCDNALGRMVKPFWVDSGFSPTEIGLISGALGTWLQILGALAGGVYIARKGIFKGLLWMGVAQIVSNFGYVAVATLTWLPRESIYAASVIESITQGLGTAAFLSFLMNICEKAHGATQYALLSAAFALSRDVAGAFSGIGVEALGYGTYFTLTALVALPAMALLPLIRSRIREDGGEAGPPEPSAA